MPRLTLAIGQHTAKGRKAVNQDFHGVHMPDEPQRTTKGVAAALADGISSSQVSQVASQVAVNSFLQDYFCTSDAWSVKQSAQRVIAATNAWLHAHTQKSPYRYDKDRGYVCTFSALVIKASTAYLFHVGDARIYRLRGNRLEQLTNDHRLWVSQGQSYLSRAMGVQAHLEIDYQAVPIQEGDVFVLATDGVYEHCPEGTVSARLNQAEGDMNSVAKALVKAAYDQGSDDNLTIQLIRVDELPGEGSADFLHQTITELPIPPSLEPRMLFDGFHLVRRLHASSRSHVYLATDDESRTPVVIKTPAADLRANRDDLERFMMEEWIARRIDSPHVVKPRFEQRERHYLYVAMEFIDGQTLVQWMRDHAKPDVEKVRDIVEQIARGLQAFHRLEMLHQDLRPHNVMIDQTSTVKIIDFGSTRVAGLTEMTPSTGRNLLGTAQYSAPEYFLGEAGNRQSDLFSLGVITYQLLTGKLPYGTDVAKLRTRSAQRRLRYRSMLSDDRDIPAWMDSVVKKAVHPNPHKRYSELSEFVHDLRHPNPSLLTAGHTPWTERHPLRFWQTVSFMLFFAVVLLLARQT